MLKVLGRYARRNNGYEIGRTTFRNDKRQQQECAWTLVHMLDATNEKGIRRMVQLLP